MILIFLFSNNKCKIHSEIMSKLWLTAGAVYVNVPIISQENVADDYDRLDLDNKPLIRHD